MPTVAAIVDQHRDEILELWEEEARKAASARGLTRPALVNFIPTYLSSLAQASDQDLGHYTSSRRALVEHHLSARMRQGFDLAEIIEEFALLGRCIARTWLAAPPKTRPEADAVERLFAELHKASAARGVAGEDRGARRRKGPSPSSSSTPRRKLERPRPVGPNAKLSGGISTPSLVIHEGAVFEGQCTMGGVEGQQADKDKDRKVALLHKEERPAEVPAIKAHVDRGK